jgi:hypothetical protein
MLWDLLHMNFYRQILDIIIIIIIIIIINLYIFNM